MRGEQEGRLVGEVEVLQEGIALIAATLETVDVDEEGRAFPLEWTPISGATGVRVDRASLTLHPLAQDALGPFVPTVAGSQEGPEVVVTLPDGPRTIRALYLEALAVLRDGEWHEVEDEADLPGGWRVAVSIPQGAGFSAPVHAAPPVELNPGIIPPLLAGARLRNRVLGLPSVEASRLRVQVLSGEFPGGLRPETFRIDGAHAWLAPEPVGLAALDASGQALWRQEGRLGEAAVVDLRAALERNLGQTVAAGGGPRTVVTVTADRPGEIRTAGISAQGAVLRAVGKRLEVPCRGEARTLEIPGAPLDARAPEAAKADLVVRHRGRRLAPLSDPVPDRPGDLEGPVLSGNVTAVRTLPPRALRGQRLVAIGVVGVVREACEVTLRVLEVVGEAPTGLLGEARATASVEPFGGFDAARPRTIWLDLPGPLPVDRPIAVEVGVSRGRMHWVADPGGAPSVRFAVSVDDPAGAEVRVGGRSFTLTGPKTELLGYDLPNAAFRGEPPTVRTDEFCDVVVTNLTLEYRP